jgi:hypothetical protein
MAQDNGDPSGQETRISTSYRELPVGTRLQLKSGATAVVIANPADGAWLLVRILESDDGSAIGSEEMVFFTDVEGAQ